MPLLYPALTLAIVALAAWLTRAYIPIPANVRPILNVVLGLIAVGIILWFIDNYVPMAGVIKSILNLVVVLAVCVWVLQAFGLWKPVVETCRDLRYRITHAARTS